MGGASRPADSERLGKSWPIEFAVRYVDGADTDEPLVDDSMGKYVGEKKVALYMRYGGSIPTTLHDPQPSLQAPKRQVEWKIFMS